MTRDNCSNVVAFPFPFTLRVPNLVNRWRRANGLPLVKQDSVTFMFGDVQEAKMFQEAMDEGVFEEVFSKIAVARAAGRSWESIRSELEGGLQ